MKNCGKSGKLSTVMWSKFKKGSANSSLQVGRRVRAGRQMRNPEWWNGEVAKTVVRKGE